MANRMIVIVNLELLRTLAKLLSVVPGNVLGVNAQERIQELADRIVVLRDAYYRGSPLVADAEYDVVEDELRSLIGANPELAPDPNPLDQVGAPAVLHAPIRHSRPMLSLEKATKPEQVAAFFDRFPGQPVVVMPKLDGLSLALVYENGRLARAITRGDGTTGDDVTMLVRALTDGIPARVDAPGRVEVRGEAVMLRSTFAAYNAAHPDKPLINPRNAAAGTLRAKDPGHRRRAAPAVLRVRPVHRARQRGDRPRRRAARRSGFTAADMRHCADAAAAQAVITAIEQQRNDLDYDLDGAVLRLADRDAYAAAGTRSSSPRGALAFKFAAEEKTTILADVVWDVGKTGKIAPVAWLEPVFVGGTTVTRATLANQEVIRARGIKIGDTVLVRRAGDVIPFVAGVLDASKRTGEEREIVPPTVCPSCGQPLTEQGNSRELFCTNVSCPAQTVRRLIHWASRAAADIDADRRRVDRAAGRGGHPGAPVGLLRPDQGEAAGVRPHRRGLGHADDRVDRREPPGRPAPGADRAGDPDGLRRHRHAPVPCGIRLAGRGRRRGCRGARRRRGHRAEGRRVPDRAPRPGCAPNSNGCARRGVSLDVREEDLPPVVAAGAPLAGKTVVVTGSISDPRSGEKVPRPTFQRLCEKAGATTASSVSASTDLLITGADVGASKLTKAEKLGVEVVDQGEIWQLLISAGIV